MPSATAIGTLMSTSASTPAKSSSIVMAVWRASVQPFRQRQAGRRLRRLALAHEFGEAEYLGDDDQHRRDRYHRLDDAHRDLGHADERVGGEHRRDHDADGAEQREEADD